MTTSYFVFYDGHSDEPQRFVERYRMIHVPILRTWPGINSIHLHTPVPWTDPSPVRPTGLTMAAQMTFEDVDALQTALQSDARAQARADFQRFPPFHGTVYHQAMRTERLL